MYPMGCGAAKFYGLPKIHKQDTFLRAIVSSCGLVTYGVAKELTKILKPLVGNVKVQVCCVTSKDARYSPQLQGCKMYCLLCIYSIPMLLLWTTQLLPL